MRGVFLAVIGLGLAAGSAKAGWYGYYKALQHEAAANQIDWVEYYKRHGYSGPGFSVPTDAQGNPQRIHWIPWQPPTMQWAVPNTALPGAPLPPPPAWGLPPY